MPSTLLFDRSDRLRLRFSGPQATATLNGLVTNDIIPLTPGEGQYAAVLSSKGKIVADVRLFVHADNILLDTSAAAGAGLLDFFRKYVNPRFATQTNVTETVSDLGVFGADAGRIVTQVTDVSSDRLAALPLFAHVEGHHGDTPLTIARVPDLGVEGYELFVSSGEKAHLWDALVQAGASPAERAQWDAKRIALGWPAWGVDMDENTLPQEANLDELQGISYSKGCYIGQEVVARIHFRGHVNKTLRRLSFAGETSPPPGTNLVDETGKEVGDVRSVAHNADTGIIGIGMVRREIDDGTTLTAQWNAGTLTDQVQIIGKAKGAID